MARARGDELRGTVRGLERDRWGQVVSGARVAAAGALLLVAAVPARAQELSAPAVVGSVAEDYLRSLQSLGAIPTGAWSIRGFSARELDRYQPVPGTHPWSHRAEFRGAGGDSAGGPAVALVPLQLDAWYNTSFPFGMNDGVVWRGRGLTASVQGGVTARWRWLSATLQPQLAWSANDEFTLMQPLSAGSPYSNPFSPRGVDAPQRFGTDPVVALHPGQSTLRADALGLTAGISTANQWWGPMSDFPFLLGNNAPGFLHAFAGTSQPLDVWVGRVHGRIIYGRLEQSAWAETHPDSMRRFAAGIIGTFSPRGAPGLEVGAARFFHTVWMGPLGGDDFLLPFRALLKDKRSVAGDTTEAGAGGDQQNQLASIFFRWVFPGSGFEAYGEFGREDHSANTFDLMQEPEHASSYGLGVRKAALIDGRMWAVRGELMNFQRSTLQHHRIQGGIYLHTFVRQGHTHLGQLLGAGMAVGAGAGAKVAVERFSERGSWGAHWMRLVTMDEFGGRPDRRPNLSVQHVLGVEHRRVVGPLEVGALLAGVYEMNRHFSYNGKNVQLGGTVRWGDR